MKKILEFLKGINFIFKNNLKKKEEYIFMLDKAYMTEYQKRKQREYFENLFKDFKIVFEPNICKR